MRALGCVPSRPDRRDFLIANFIPIKAAGELPAEYRVPGDVPVHDQDGVGQCVAFTCAAIKEYQELKERGSLAHWSPNYIYGKRDPDMYLGEGMEPRDALKALQKYGICRLEVNSDLDTFDRACAKITPDMDADARPQRIKTYARINTAQELKSALYHTGACMVAIAVYPSFQSCPSDGMLPMPGPGEAIQGYHAVTCVGWRTDGRLIIQNSWGTSWGDRGFCYMPAEYPIMEMWAVTDLAPPFIDVEPDRWSAEAIAKVKNVGLMLGDPDGRFRPADPVTREEMATILVRALKL